MREGTDVEDDEERGWERRGGEAPKGDREWEMSESRDGRGGAVVVMADDGGSALLASVQLQRRLPSCERCEAAELKGRGESREMCEASVEDSQSLRSERLRRSSNHRPTLPVHFLAAAAERSSRLRLACHHRRPAPSTALAPVRCPAHTCSPATSSRLPYSFATPRTGVD